MAKVKTLYLCQSCGYESQRWMGRCPDCGEWNTFVRRSENKNFKRSKCYVISETVSLKSDTDYGRA